MDRGKIYAIFDLSHKAYFSSLEKEDKNALKDETPATLRYEMGERFDSMIQLLNLAVYFDEAGIQNRLLNHLNQFRKLYQSLEFGERLVQNANLCQNASFIGRLIEFVRPVILGEYEKGLRDKKDQSIQKQLICSCEDCEEVGRFLQHATQIQLSYAAVEQQRKHMKQICESSDMPVFFDTLKKSRPYQLLITKSPTLYQEAKKRYERLATWIQKAAAIC